jgi:L-ascorbate metabolism protein UlaG (beta-lactamase superfamily)
VIANGATRPRARRAASGADVLARVTWLGHSTVEVELDGVRLVTDPLLRNRVAHLRRVAPLVLPRPADLVLVSHAHHDHLDLPSLALVTRRGGIAVPAGAGELLRRRGFADVTELEVGGEIAVGPVVVRATYAAHGGRRALTRTVAPPIGYLIEGSCRIYFAGDTDVFPDMAALAPGLSLALVPIGGWGARVPAGHLDARRAAEALRLLRPCTAVPIHWGTYRQVGLARDDAVAERFVRAVHALAPSVEPCVLPVGGDVEVVRRDAERAATEETR